MIQEYPVSKHICTHFCSDYFGNKSYNYVYKIWYNQNQKNMVVYQVSCAFVV